MRTSLICTPLTILCCGLVLASCAAAQDADSAYVALQTGDYDKARQIYGDLIESGGEGATQHALGYVEAFMAVGDYQEGLTAFESLLANYPNDPYVLHGRGRLLMGVGRYAEAEQAFQDAGQGQPFWDNNIAWAGLMEETGRRREAIDLYAPLYQMYRQNGFQTAHDLALAGRALARVGEFRDANEAHGNAFKIDPTHLQNLVWWGGLFHDKYNEADAQRTIEDGLRVNPKHADLNVVYARSVGGFGQQEQHAQAALQTNPNHVGAMSIIAGLRILDAQYDEAEDLLEQALAVNPSSIEALAHMASVHHLRGDTLAFAEVEKQALSVNPSSGDFYLILAQNTSRRFRYPDAVEFAFKAVTADRQNYKAYAELGIGLLRQGRAREARRYLDYSFNRDPYNVFVGNTLTLIDEYEDFETFESEHFRLIIHQDEADVLGQAILDMAELCFDSLSTRYTYVPQDKILVEAYQDHDDFAVRVGGIPHIGLLGVSFGDIVAMDTPRAQGDDSYNWARTLWHELAHTMAIGVSDFRVPRWFTEGLSVYEEQRARPVWDREMDLQLFSALDQDKLLPIDQLDRGFTRPQFPGQILLSYYHASKVIGFIADRHGFDAIDNIMLQLQKGLPIKQSLEQVLGEPTEVTNTAFFDYLKQERARMADVMDGFPNPFVEEGGAHELPTNAGSFFDALQQGQQALQTQNFDAAETHFRESIDQYPNWIETGNAYQGLAAIYRTQDETDKLTDILKDYLAIAEHAGSEAHELGTLLQAAGDAEGAIYYYNRALEVNPYEIETHTSLADLYEQTQRYSEAVQARRAVLALDPVDRAKAYYELAGSLYHTNQYAAAKRAVLQALEIAPGYREAQKLLLQWVDGT